MIPWPISDLPRIKVTRLSGVMRTHASNGLGVFFSCSTAWPTNPRADSRKPTTSAAPPAAPVLKNSRRENAGLFAIRHPGTTREEFPDTGLVRRTRYLPVCREAAWWMALRMRWYVPQRQMFPLMASSMSASVGLGFFASSATADMICPDWQYPHCGTSSSIQAFCTGCDASAESPSIVVIFFPATLETCVMQDRVASPLMCTVHAPQSAMPHPNFVPVMFSVSRNTQRSGICGSTSTVVDFPFSVKVVPIVRLPQLVKYPTTPRHTMEIA